MNNRILPVSNNPNGPHGGDFQDARTMMSFKVGSSESGWFSGFFARIPSQQLGLDSRPSVTHRKKDRKQSTFHEHSSARRISSIYIKQTVCTYVPLSRANRRTNLHQFFTDLYNNSEVLNRRYDPTNLIP